MLIDQDRLDRIRYWTKKNHRMPKRTVELPCYFEFTRDDLRALAFGWVPEQMEDHWFGLLQEGAIDFHRSWTGYHTYRLPLQQEGDKVIATKVIINNWPSQYRRNPDDLWNQEMVARLLYWMLREGRELLARSEELELAGGRGLLRDQRHKRTLDPL